MFWRTGCVGWGCCARLDVAKDPEHQRFFKPGHDAALKSLLRKINRGEAKREDIPQAARANVARIIKDVITEDVAPQAGRLRVARRTRVLFSDVSTTDDKAEQTQGSHGKRTCSRLWRGGHHIARYWNS